MYIYFLFVSLFGDYPTAVQRVIGRESLAQCSLREAPGLHRVSLGYRPFVAKKLSHPWLYIVSSSSWVGMGGSLPSFRAWEF